MKWYSNAMKIMSIETSCDETGVAILAQDNGNKKITLLGNALASQIELHAQYGGVFPAMAKRAHAQKIVPLMKSALEEAGLLIPYRKTSNETDTSSTPPSAAGTAARETILSICTHEDEMVTDFIELFNAYQKPDIDYIAVTVGPGLEPALWVGINAAKVLAAVWDIPVIPVNHMEGHVVTAAVIESSFQAPQHSDFEKQYSKTEPEQDVTFSGPSVQYAARSGSQKKIYPAREGIAVPNKYYEFQNLQFPLLALLVSGGHTELVLVNNYGDYKKIGQTRDDAVGEAFDKVARMLGLPYPGGPAVSKLAREFRASPSASNAATFEMPRPMLHSGDYDFSFSGIKTAMLYTIRDLTENNSRELTDTEKQALACAFEDAVVEVIIKKTLRAAEESRLNDSVGQVHIQTIVVGGGVAGNTYLREQLLSARNFLAEKGTSIEVLFPEPWLATDNAVMIGLAAFARIMEGSSHSNSSGQVQTQDPLTLKANGNLSIESKQKSPAKTAGPGI
jgi:N6-L-threonylcarbamoyladenine synthase